MNETNGAVRIAVVEDDDELREAILVPLLRQAGHEVVGMGSALDLYRDLVASRYDLVLLDVGLPDEDGVAIAGHLRGVAPDIGLVMLSGYCSEADRLRGLEAGADAYLAKPVESGVLLATIENLVRRLAPQAVQPKGWRFDEQGWRVVLPDGRSFEMSLVEQQLLRCLAASPGNAVPRERIIAALTSDPHGFDPHRLEMLVHRLRRKCRDTTGEELPLRAVRGVGYLLAW
ncbi:response regulator transcription factor [Luteimonas deserti]|uniref:Response regulator transcription factor n=1 Tax=Luteimonas deserti TaxID=2752306 RepID=A0A7Z0QPG7_9GAMM|nr:response regulator transcription factor [Luteimonas deserti]NYZ62396.1 response regulator transcription factor [Luteimonas deserti]